jgi:alkyl hydroperoxide reductase subunit AhpC
MIGKWLVLFFYPFDFTFVCPTEIISFSESVDIFRKINTEIVAVSTDSHHTHLAWIKTPRDQGGLGKMKIPLIADVSKRISEDYGVLVTDEDDEMYGAALRGLFIIDPEGIIRSIQINDDAVGRSVDETLRILKAFQYAASHPNEVCPANWKPGGKTIKTDHTDKVEFFSEVYPKNEL